MEVQIQNDPLLATDKGQIGSEAGESVKSSTEDLAHSLFVHEYSSLADVILSPATI
jgi:hypothetical protein